ncbi:electron transfer flavoprotein subunit beta/FixA family protein [Nocardiopsis sp. LOL_012]|uniref:electron transfer flavoprotein subunit beta/FixA family protein n=1 Tax=Nocardiopsis sp. LOL_012 TaxID=3345409 RepID=UPI003A88B727
MNIVVLVKQVPDTATERKLSDADNTLDRAASDGVINELDEYAIEEALQLKEKHGGEVTVLTMGPDQATDSIRKALSMGADKAVFVNDDALHGSDALQTAYALAQALGTIEYDLVVLGSESTDARTGVVGAALAEYLGLPQLTFAGKVDVDGGVVRIQRQTDYGYDVVEAQMPAVVSVVEKINEPRYPSFKLIMQAKKKPVDKKSAADAGIDTGKVGLANATTETVDFAAAPPRAAGTIVTDEGDGGAKIADFLSEKKFV